MMSLRKRRALLQQVEQRVEDRVAQWQQLPSRVEEAVFAGGSAARVAMTAAWVTGALAVLAAGLYAGRELRSRYKLKRRTPYDYYAHAGDRSDLDFGVGI